MYPKGKVPNKVSTKYSGIPKKKKKKIMNQVGFISKIYYLILLIEISSRKLEILREYFM